MSDTRRPLSDFQARLGYSPVSPQSVLDLAFSIYPQTGTGAPTINAIFVGQKFIDTAGQKEYVAVQTGTGPSDWVETTAIPGGALEVIQTGTVAPTANATFIGQRFIDTTNLVGYMAVATGGGAADWAQVTP